MVDVESGTLSSSIRELLLMWIIVNFLFTVNIIFLCQTSTNFSVGWRNQFRYKIISSTYPFFWSKFCSKSIKLSKCWRKMTINYSKSYNHVKYPWHKFKFLTEFERNNNMTARYKFSFDLIYIINWIAINKWIYITKCVFLIVLW